MRGIFASQVEMYVEVDFGMVFHLSFRSAEPPDWSHFKFKWHLVRLWCINMHLHPLHGW